MSLFASFAWVPLAMASEPLRLPVTLVQANPITTITVGDRRLEAVVDTGGGVLVLSRDAIDAGGGVKLADAQVWNDAMRNEYRAG